MFTGIIESLGVIKEVITDQQNIRFWVASDLSHDLKIDQSVSHNGICLTVEELRDHSHLVTAVHETIVKTNIGSWKKDDPINLERCMIMNGRLDGHIVQGHVDCIATCTDVIDERGSWRYTFQFPQEYAHLLVDKGSVAISGVSLTVITPTHDSFQVAIIPYTYEHTIFKNIKKENTVNIEFDILGKYVARGLQLQK